MAEKIGVVGAGAWGTALAKVLAELGHEVRLWCREEELAKAINEGGENKPYLPGVALPPGLVALSDPLAAVADRDVVILAVPSSFLLATLRRILPSPRIMEGESLIVTVTKGFIPGPRGPRLIFDALEEHLPGFYRGNLVYLSGPSHAEEVGRGKITGLVAASQNGRNGIRTRELFRGSRVLVFPSFDTTGVQVAAAAKNVIAIAFGMLDALASSAGLAGGAGASAGGPAGGVSGAAISSFSGLALANGGGVAEAIGLGPFDETAFGDNTESLLLAAGLNEIQTLGTALGATHPETFASIAGVGDLDVTCRSVHGRNRRFGRQTVEKGILAPFRDLDDLISRLDEIGYLPEGVVAVKQIHAIAEAKGLSLPIMEGVYSILDRRAEPRSFLETYLGALGAS